MKFLLILLFIFPLSAEKIGIGIDVDLRVTVNNDSDDDSPGFGKQIYFPIILANNIMLEPSFSYYSKKIEMDYDNSSIIDEKDEENTMLLQIGIYMTKKYKDMRAYAGCNIGRANIIREYTLNENQENDINYFYPTLGLEYLINQNFSFGIEALLPSVTFEDELEGVGKYNYKTTSSDYNMKLRMYF